MQLNGKKIMAKRPVFIPVSHGGLLVKTIFVEFNWHPGFAVKQKQRNISCLHDKAYLLGGISNILEVSSKSENELGVSLSAFNLKGKTKKYEEEFTVETLFQSSKVFKFGGPYRDLLCKTSLEAKKDERIKESGTLIGFDLFGDIWELEPKTAFYDYIYIKTLLENKHLIDDILKYDAFTDIEFNPEKSINCQAYSVALFKALSLRCLLPRSVSNKKAFLDTIKNRPISTSSDDSSIQQNLF